MKKLPLILGGVLVVGILAMLFLKPDVDIQQKVASGPTKVGFVYLTNPGDHGWTYAHEVGRKELQAHFGDKVETSYVENVPEGPDAARVIRELLKKETRLSLLHRLAIWIQLSAWLKNILMCILTTSPAISVCKCGYR